VVGRPVWASSYKVWTPIHLRYTRRPQTNTRKTKWRRRLTGQVQTDKTLAVASKYKV